MAKPGPCTACKQVGHNKRTCPALEVDRQRGLAIDLENAARVAGLVADKNPAHWERLKAARTCVALELEAALSELSDKAPAVKHIKLALHHLENCR